jgi:hypothetical protein
MSGGTMLLRLIVMLGIVALAPYVLADPVLLLKLPLTQDISDLSANSFSTSQNNVSFASGAATFDGSSSYIVINDPSGKLSFNFNTDTYSITFLIKFSSLSLQEIYVDRASTQNQVSAVAILLQDGKFACGSWDGVNGGNVIGSTAISVGVWYRFCVVCDKGMVYLYLNGTLDGSRSWSVNNTKNTEPGRTIGRYSGSSYGSYTAAQIKDFRIYSGALPNGLPPADVAPSISALNYTYDLNGRLTFVSYTNGVGVNHTYDTAGNVIHVTTNSLPADTTQPTVAITSPANGTPTSSTVITVSGSATDNDRVGWVSYQWNDSPWFIGSTVNAWTNWAATVLLNPGANVIRAFAVDNTGNISTTNTINVTCNLSTSPPSIQPGQSLGISSNGFGFNLTGTNLTVVVEACTNLASPEWVPVQTNNLSNGPVYFSDPTWTNYPARFYRLRVQ